AAELRERDENFARIGDDVAVAAVAQGGRDGEERREGGFVRKSEGFVVRWQAVFERSGERRSRGWSHEQLLAGVLPCRSGRSRIGSDFSSRSHSGVCVA